jgi:hypothetical protein
MIGVFINPGRKPEQPEPNLQEWGDRTTNRPTEYNTLDDKYARVIVDELMPVLYKEYNISKDPDLHGIGGSSSGAIAAHTMVDAPCSGDLTTWRIRSVSTAMSEPGMWRIKGVTITPGINEKARTPLAAWRRS